MSNDIKESYHRGPWNKGKLTGQRGLALFNLAIDSKLRGCNLVALRVKDVAHGGQIARRAIILQRKTQRPVQFEITDQTRESLATWIAKADLKPEQYLFPSRLRASPNLSTRQYARIVDRWVSSIGLDPTTYGTLSMRRTKATLIYKLRSINLIYEWFISKVIHRVAMQPARLLHIKDRAPWVLTAFEPAASAIRSYG
ncbi:MAG: tyrosine-type recombinase/integrase [Acidithiobacillus ferrivorans]